MVSVVYQGKRRVEVEDMKPTQEALKFRLKRSREFPEEQRGRQRLMLLEGFRMMAEKKAMDVLFTFTKEILIVLCGRVSSQILIID